MPTVVSVYGPSSRPCPYPQVSLNFHTFYAKTKTIFRYLVDAKFIKPIYSILLKRDLTVEDLKYVDEDIYTNLMWVKNNNIEEVELNMFFEVDVEIFGKRETRELVKNGSQIEVTEKNKLDYIQKMVRFRLEHGIKPQMDGLAYGFNEVVNTKQLKNLEISDLELILNGAQEIDIQDWRSHTEYRGGYFDSHDNIQIFWLFITQLSDGRTYFKSRAWTVQKKPSIFVKV